MAEECAWGVSGGGLGSGCEVRGRLSEGLYGGREQYGVRGGVQWYCALLGWKEGLL